MADRDAGGWRARGRAAALMYGSGAAVTALSVLPSPPPEANRGGILALAGMAVVAAVVIPMLRGRYTVAVSHVTSVTGTMLVAGVIYMAGGSYLSLLYSMIYIWVVLFAVFFYGTKGALVHASICSGAIALGLAHLSQNERITAWAIATATLFIIVACYHFMQRYSTRLRGLVEHSGGVVTIVDRELRIEYQTPSVERILGYQLDEFASTNLLEVVHPDDREHVLTVLTELARGGRGSTTLECRFRHRDGSWRHAESSVENLLDDGSIDGIVLNIRDVTDRKLLQDQLVHRAFHDPLTGLANRALFADRVEHARAGRGRTSGQLGVLLLDLDDFKSVNDSLGHNAGDTYLVALAERLRACVRPGDTVARLGGDEFAILLPECSDEHGLEAVARRLLDAFGSAVEVEQGEMFASLSIGGVLATTGQEGAEELLRDADAAMYLAKRRGKGRYERFESGMNAPLLRRLQLKSDLRGAVERGELRVLYQPIVSLTNGVAFGVEALARWQHPTLGLVAPAEFIPLAEETGMIADVGRWVLKEACEQGRRWDWVHAALPPLRMMVNVSARQLQDDEFVEDVQTALWESGLAPAKLVLEITESVLLDDVELAVQRLQRLKDVGVTIAIDDFGTGYSGLNYLQELPVDLVKIDKSFIDGLAPEGGKNRPVVDAVIQLVQSLGLRALAEGIEHEDQARHLRQLNCEYGQGYLFSRPVPADVVAAWLETARVADVQRLDAASAGPQAALYGRLVAG